MSAGKSAHHRRFTQGPSSAGLFVFASRPNGLNYKTAAFALARGLDAD